MKRCLTVILIFGIYTCTSASTTTTTTTYRPLTTTTTYRPFTSPPTTYSPITTPTTPTTSYRPSTTTAPITTTVPPTTVPPAVAKIWVLLVASSTGYFNYRHQADICHAYQLIHANGIPDEQIIVMMADDIAYNPENPTPGVIINTPGGKNVYEGVPKDYTGKLVTPENFLNVLSGNKAAMRGIGSGRVIESGPNDYIFVNFVDHGGPGVLVFGEDHYLTADELKETLVSMADYSKFAKMFMYIEACHAGSMFDDILPDDLNIIAMTAADPHENSFACYYDQQRQTYLADVFSATWMYDTLQETLSAESMHHQFERVRTWTNTSHVEEYGDLSVGSMHLSNFLGFNMNLVLNSPSSKNPPKLTDLISNIDVPMTIMENKINYTKDETEKRFYKLKMHHMIKMRKNVDQVIEKLVRYLAGDNMDRHTQLKHETYKLGSSNLLCYKQVLRKFSDRCFNVAKHPYVRVHLAKLVNMCNASWVTKNNILDAISAVCEVKINYSTRIM